MYSEYVFVDLGIQRTICMRHIFICGMSGSVVFIHTHTHTHTHTNTHTQILFKKKVHWTWNVFWFSLQILSVTFRILRRTERAMSIGLHVKYPVLLTDFNVAYIFSKYFGKVHKHKILWKSVHWEPNCFTRTDGWTNRHDEANSRFSQFCECAKNCCVTTHPSFHLYTGVQTSRYVQYIAANENYAMRTFYHTVQHAKQSVSDNTTKENRSRSHWISDNCAVSGLMICKNDSPFNRQHQ
jgi:hypothetical protein